MNITVEELYSYANFIKGEYKLDNMVTLIEELGLKELPYKIIHVAGTNGKGSVCLKIANTLTDSGYKTGLFSSPHIATFRERIQIDRKLIEEPMVFSVIEEVMDAYKRKKLHPTFFDIMTLTSLLYFKNEKVEFAVLETGLGGRLDSTNVVAPILSVITSIALDHQAVLGENLEQIAFEKAGIIKQGVPIVLGPKACLKPILEKAKDMDARVFSVKENFSFYDLENQAIAKLALNYLKETFSLKYKDLNVSLHSRPICRFEVFENIIFDVAHNEDGMHRLIQGLINKFPEKKFRFIIGLSQDKKRKNILSEILPVASHIHIVTTGERLASIQEIISDLKQLDYSFFSYEKSLEETVSKALLKANDNKEILVVTGSFFHMCDIKKALGIKLEKDPLVLNERMSTK